MKIQIILTSPIARWGLGGVVLILVSAITGFASLQFIVSAISSPRMPIDLATIESATRYFPGSARLQARLASNLIESQTENIESHELIAERAFRHALSAVQLAPENHQYRLLLAAAAELRGEMRIAESALLEAVKLAPTDINVRWQMANLYLRVGKLEEALVEFRVVAAHDPVRLPIVMSLVWQATNGNYEMLDRMISRESQDRLALAQFLVEQSQFDTSARVFRQIDRDSRLKMQGSGNYLDAMLRAGQWQLAGELWKDTVAGQAEGGNDLFWNGSFDKQIQKSLAQFDWQFVPSNFARLQVAAGSAHTGQHALMIAYKGIETTKLKGEAKHAVLVQPGGAYRLGFFAKSERLVTPNGPQIAILRPDNLEVIATSLPISTGSTDWQWMTVDFTAPSDAHAVWVAIQQTPQYSYVEPTIGIVRFDDFSLKAQ